MEQESNVNQWPQEIIQNLVDCIKKQRIVPIIGNDAFYVNDEKRGNVPVQRFIIETAKEKYNIENDDIFLSGLEGMTALKTELEKKGKDPILELKSIINSTPIKLYDEVETFLKNGNFPLIISTTIFDIGIEEKRYKPIRYEKARITDILIKGTELGCAEQIEQPTIMYLFGVANADNIGFVYTEQDFLEYLHALHNEETKPQKLITYMHNNKYIFSIGCDIPDWTFRFLLYSIKELKRQIAKNKFYGGAIGESMEESMERFLKRFSYQSQKGLRSTLTIINNKMAPVTKTRIFLSLHSADYKTIGQNIVELMGSKYKIWFFEEEEKRGDFWNKIKEAIEETDFFMPVITANNIVEILRREKEHNEKEINENDRGFLYEWQLALRHWKKHPNKKRYCIPYFPDRNIAKNFNDELPQRIAVLAGLFSGNVTNESDNVKGVQYIFGDEKHEMTPEIVQEIEEYYFNHNTTDNDE